jgi:hypothetical protein
MNVREEKRDSIDYMITQSTVHWLGTAKMHLRGPITDIYTMM